MVPTETDLVNAADVIQGLADRSTMEQARSTSKPMTEPNKRGKTFSEQLAGAEYVIFQITLFVLFVWSMGRFLWAEISPLLRLLWQR